VGRPARPIRTGVTQLSALVREIQNPMYRLALRFLGDPDDAQDACQEILIRIVTRLGSFEGRSRFTTWAYTVAVRSLLRTHKRLVESSAQGAGQFAAFLDAGLADIDTTLVEAEYRLVVRGGPDQLHLRDAAVPAATAARRLPAR
jgi:RNA polymerase sigma factor (sigma-70 family)